MSIGDIKTLREIILDERRPVTYITVSKELCMHVNKAKVLLQTFIEDTRNTRTDVDLNINYIVAGLSKDNGARITVCSEDTLKETIKSFKSVFFQHVYSICQGSGFVDNAILASTKDFEDLPLCLGLIKGMTCAKRSSEEIGTLKTNSQSIVEEPQPSINLQKDIKSKVKTEVIKENDVQIQESKSEPTTANKSESGLNKEVETSKRNGKVSNGIAGFFNRNNSNTSTKKTKGETKTENSKTDEVDTKKIKVEAMEVDDNHTETKKGKLEVINDKLKTKDDKDLIMNLDKNKKTEIESNNKQAKELTNAQSKSTTITKKNAKVDKKRKRVLLISDSESEEEKNDPFVEESAIDRESDNEIPPTPSTNTVKITSGIVNPKKKRKIVDKTYTHEDGYMLTRKEEVYESCSDNEEVKENNVKENILKNNVKIEVSPPQNKSKSKKKISPPQKGKQASITSFFQKK